jgi:signal peptide peptidase SppA
MSSRPPLHRLAALVYNTPLLITPAKAEIISGVLQAHIEARMSGMAVEPRESDRDTRPSAFIGETLANESGNGRTPYRVKDGKAIITIDGELVNRGEWVGADSGLVSYDGIKHQLAMATKDSRVKSIILDINSPGGEAIGAFDAAAAVRQAAAIKPVTAIANGMAASAAYGLASGATRRVIAQDGIGGSIGVVMMHVDMSRALENRGIKPTLIFAGAHKVDGNPFQALPANVRDHFQREVNSFYDMFVKTVATGTGLTEQQVRDTEARVFIGQDAVKAGLFDAVGTFEDVISGSGRASSSTHSSRVAASLSGCSGITQDDFAKAPIDVAIGRKIMDAVAARQRTDPTFTTEKLRREVSGS